MNTTLVCMLLKLKLYFVEVDLVNLACLNDGHEMCDNHAATYVDQ